MKTMKSKADIEREVLETLELLERPEELPPDPRFYGRVTARLAEERTTWRPLSAVLKPALITALIVLNLFTAVRYFSGRERQVAAQNREKLLEALAGDLNLGGDGQASVLGKQE